MPSRSIVSRAARAVGTTCSPSASSSSSTVRRDRLELGDDEQLRARPRALGLEHRAQRGGVGHVDHGVALGDLHRRRVGVAVDRDHLAAEPHRLDRHLAAELAAAQQHDAHGGVGQRRSGGEAHDRAAYALASWLRRVGAGASGRRNAALGFRAFCAAALAGSALRFVGSGAMASGKQAQPPGRASGQAGGAAASATGRGARHRRIRCGAPRATICREAATLEDALDAELWASALLGSWWPPPPALLSTGDSDVELGGPLVVRGRRGSAGRARSRRCSRSARSPRASSALLALSTPTDLLAAAHPARRGVRRSWRRRCCARPSCARTSSMTA